MTSLHMRCPSVNPETGEEVGTTNYRLFVGDVRYRNDGESIEEYESYLDSIATLHLPRKKNESKDDHGSRAFALFRQWYTIGATW